MAEPTQPWAERTLDMSEETSPGFLRGVASVKPGTSQAGCANDELSGAGWPDTMVERAEPRMPAGYHLRQLRHGGGWSMTGGLFAFVCWGIWAISARGDLTSPVVTFLLTLLVAVGLFALGRLLGRVVLERPFGRVRRGARGAHLLAGLFLTGAGIAYLRQTEWVVDAWNWFQGLF